MQEQGISETREPEAVGGADRDKPNVKIRKNPPRERKLPIHLDDVEVEVDKLHQNIDFCYKMALGIPVTYAEAMQMEWQKAISEEMSPLAENDTYEVTTLPRDRKKVGGR